MGNLPAIERFSIANKRQNDPSNPTPHLEGPLPTELGQLSTLEQFRIYDTWGINGTIPTEYGNLMTVNNFQVRNNRLSGVLPSELGLLTNIQRLYLEGNEFSGSIISELGNLTNIATLSVELNDLTGSIPASICASAFLDEVDADCDKVICTCCNGPVCCGAIENKTSIFEEANCPVGEERV